MRAVPSFDLGHERHAIACPTELIEQSGLTAKKFAKLLGCSAMLVSLMLSGKRELSKANVVTLARHFKVDAVYLL